MTGTTEATGRNSLGGATWPVLAPIRLGIGLLQGFGLYGLTRAIKARHGLCSSNVESLCPRLLWPATEPLLSGPLLLETALPAFPDLVLGGVRLRHQEGEPDCPVEP